MFIWFLPLFPFPFKDFWHFWPDLSAKAQKFWIFRKKNSLWVSLVRVLCYVFVDCLLCCKVIHVFDPNRPVQVFGQNCMLSSWRLLGEHQQNRAFFAKIGLIFRFCAWKGHTYFAKMSKILKGKVKKIMGEIKWTMPR